MTDNYIATEVHGPRTQTKADNGRQTTAEMRDGSIEGRKEKKYEHFRRLFTNNRI